MGYSKCHELGSDHTPPRSGPSRPLSSESSTLSLRRGPQPERAPSPFQGMSAMNFPFAYTFQPQLIGPAYLRASTRAAPIPSSLSWWHGGIASTGEMPAACRRSESGAGVRVNANRDIAVRIAATDGLQRSIVMLRCNRECSIGRQTRERRPCPLLRRFPSPGVRSPRAAPCPRG